MTETAAAPRNPFVEAAGSKKMFILLAIFIGVTANLMISTTNSTVLVATAKEIGGMEIYPLASSISGILGICIMPIYGYLSSKGPHNRRMILAVSAFVGVLTCLLRAVSPNMIFLILTGVLWGMVSAGNFVVGYTMIRDMYDKNKAAIFIGFIGTAMGVGKLVGPIISGFMVDNLASGWRVWFWFLTALMLVSAILAFLGPKVKKEEVAHMVRGAAKLDIPGCIAMIVLLAGIIISLSLPAQVPPGSPLFFGLLAMSAVALIAFILIVRSKKDNALIPLSVVTDRNTVFLSLMNFMANMSVVGILFFLPAYVMRVLVEDPLVLTLGPALAAGMLTTLIGICGAILSPIYGKMIGKAGNARTVCIIAFAGRVVVMVGLLVFVSPTCPVWLLWILMFMAGVYNGANTCAASVGAQVQIKQSMRAMSNSLVQLGQNLGASLGIVIFTFITSTYGITDGMPIGLWLSLGLAVIFLIVSLPLKKLSPEEDN